MLTNLYPYGSIGTIAYVIIVFAMIPGVLFLLSRAAVSSHPEPYQMDEVRRLAELICDACERIFQKIPALSEDFALHELKETAEVFSTQMHGPRRNPALTQSAFLSLQRSF